ncbi:hypothetical protein [Mannheimia indoligenes]|uniref:hypothetical protein n=1 Tax=Mannheimia indoligenes TaxID=3103145 RepID=UPI002FE58EB3
MKIFNKYLILMLGLILSLNSFAGNDLSMFKPNVQPLVKKFINNEKPKEKDIVNLLNKEFGKEILKIEDIDGEDFIDKNMDLSEKELNKLKSITKYLTDEKTNGKGKSGGIALIGIVEMRFDY